MAGLCVSLCTVILAEVLKDATPCLAVTIADLLVRFKLVADAIDVVGIDLSKFISFLVSGEIAPIGFDPKTDGLPSLLFDFYNVRRIVVKHMGIYKDYNLSAAAKIFVLENPNHLKLGFNDVHIGATV